MPERSEEWLEALAKWQGKMDTLVKGLNRNDDDIDAKLDALYTAHYTCREQMLKAVVELDTTAKHHARNWAIVVALIVAAITTIPHFLP